jgi:predicted Zn-dependent protease
MFIKNYSLPDFSKIREAIHQTRRRLSEYPNNPILWTNLSLYYTTNGQQDKAKHAILVALKLAPENRFVVRAASRLFLHQKDSERAHSVLLRTASIQFDPWILASEVAVAATRNRSSQFVKRARSMVESQDYRPFHLSELAARINAIIRRKMYNGNNVIRFNEIFIDTLAKEVRV